jgi:hypothetical protein
MMGQRTYDLTPILASPSLSADDRLRFLAVVNLGVVQALRKNAIDIADAQSLLYNGRNGCLIRELRPAESAEDILARGVQLGDLDTALSKKEAAQERGRELSLLERDSLSLLHEIQLRQQRSESEVPPSQAEGTVA